jgi:hypothetical protein
MGIEDPKHQQTILQKRPGHATRLVSRSCPPGILIACRLPGGIKMVKFRELLRFADRTDMMLMAAGVIGAMGQGALMPLMTTFLGDLMEGLFSQDLATAKESTQKTALVFLYLGIAMFVVGWMAMGFFAMSAVRQGAAVRMAYLKVLQCPEMRPPYRTATTIFSLISYPHSLGILLPLTALASPRSRQSCGRTRRGLTRRARTNFRRALRCTLRRATAGASHVP